MAVLPVTVIQDAFATGWFVSLELGAACPFWLATD